MKIISAMDQKIGVKFIIHGPIHEEAFHGPCRYSDLEKLTREAETESIEKMFKEFCTNIGSLKLPECTKVLAPEKMNVWIEKENPEIMLEAEQLEKLKIDSDETDLFVVVGGLSQYTCLKIAEMYNKPVAMIANGNNGWAIDMPAGLRHKGFEGFFLLNWEELSRLIKALYVRKCFSKTRILVLTESFGQIPKGVISDITDYKKINNKYGIDFIHIGYEEFFSQMDLIKNDNTMNEDIHKTYLELIENAQWNDMTEENMLPSILFYKTVQFFMNEYECNAFTTECFEMCSSMRPWKNKFTPCLGHSLLKDQGIPAACENDINALLSMMMFMYSQEKAIKMGNPEINIEKRTLTVFHDVSSLKMKGFDQPDLEYGIKNFTESGFGVTLRYDFSKDRNNVVTFGRFSPSGDKMLLSKGNILDSIGYKNPGCTEGVIISIEDPYKLWEIQSNFGHHLSLVYGDAIEDVKYCSKIMGFEVVEV